MIDVYNKTVFDRNSIQHVPAEYADTAAANLLKFLGSFWTSINKDIEFVKGVQKVRGIRLAQFYLDLLESLKLQDRKGMPVFHRELWKPIILRKSSQNKSQENVIKIAGDIVIGPQKEGSRYGEGTNLQLGKLANFADYVTYDVDSGISTIASNISNSIIDPTVIYKVSDAFPSEDVVYVNGTLIFPKDKDPFAPGSGFDVYDVDFDADGNPDSEVVIWASDVLIDKQFLSTHMAYALGVKCDSSHIAKRILNADWDAINCGLTPELYKTILAAMLNVPVIQNKSERIVDIVTTEGEDTIVITDSNRYTVYKDAKLRSCVYIGSVLKRGELLDQSVKIYPLLTDVTPEKLSGMTEYADIIEHDIPALTMPGAMLSTRTSSGLCVDWNPVDVFDTGEVDKNGHRKLFFEINGPQKDVDAFWSDVWGRAEEEDIDLDDLFSACEDDGTVEDDDGTWKIRPMAFFLKHMVGANTLIVTLDSKQIRDTSIVKDPMFFNMLKDSVPSGMRLFVVEHIDIVEDPYTLGSEDAEHTADASDSVTVFAEDYVDDELFYQDLPGIRGKHIPTYEDQVEMKFFRNRKRNAS